MYLQVIGGIVRYVENSSGRWANLLALWVSRDLFPYETPVVGVRLKFHDLSLKRRPGLFKTKCIDVVKHSCTQHVGTPILGFLALRNRAASKDT
jgi:hypothetical protein